MAHLLQRRVVAALPRTRILLVEGRDAVKFLQGIFTNDVNELKARGDVRYGGFLTHKGRVVGDADIVQKEAESFFVTYDASLEDDLVKHMKKYKLRSKVSITNVDEHFRAHVALPALLPKGNEASLLDAWSHEQNSKHADGVVYADPRSALLGYKAILPTSTALDTPSSEYEVDADDSLFLRDRRLLLGVCEGAELRDGIPLEFNFDLLGGVSMTKGCYVGQELISRTHYKGNIRKRAVPFLVVPADHAADVPPFTFGAAPSSFAQWTELLATDAPSVAIDQKLVHAESAATVGKVLVTATGMNAGVGMLRLEHLKGGKILTQDGQFQAVPVAPTWWPHLNPETGKKMQ
ncbi:Aste57867_16867 [Aphanomyces stellatus]|uniref:Aste57867_16867 protein n=1 Tax=Aphanomyces stellatus TaxID=120398 RepID=A0A485L7Z8_9STRA|nr:hypothetical protein As57867_016809 [Aphanomyces stellatus]VFT93630.1 Aste57867_16867 [Aphanomyces stellatus]